MRKSYHEAINSKVVFQNNQDKKFIKKVSNLIPMGRLAKKEEIGNTLIFLLSNLSSYVNGATISVDGGRTSW